MDIDHQTLVGFAKSFGLLYLLAMCTGVLVYTFWPSNRERFDRAAKDIIDDEDMPCR